MTIREIWDNIPTSEKINGIAFVALTPVLVALLGVVMAIGG